MIFCGIDPGKAGAIVAIDDERNVLFKETMKEVTELYSIISSLIANNVGDHKVFIGLEKAQALSRGGVAQGAVGMATYFMGYGELRGMLKIMGVPYAEIPPQTWCKALHVGATGDNAKARSLDIVKKIFPKENLLATSRCKKAHEGFIDALLIAEYTRRKYGKS